MRIRKFLVDVVCRFAFVLQVSDLVTTWICDIIYHRPNLYKTSKL